MIELLLLILFGMVYLMIEINYLRKTVELLHERHGTLFNYLSISQKQHYKLLCQLEKKND